MQDAQPPHRIGVFDSGVGGLSVLRAIRQRLPDVAITYIGDVAHAPYGERRVEVIDRGQRIVENLVGRGARMIVVACNTLTVLGIERLRRDWPGVGFVGVEPGIKPAAARSRTRRIAVLATPATAASPRLHALIAAHAAGCHVHVQPCPGLAAAIESGAPKSHLRALLTPFCEPARRAGVDVVVLGCTHYAFVSKLLSEQFGSDVALLDTADAVARRAASQWTFARSAGIQAVEVLSSGATQTMSTLLAVCAGLEGVAVGQVQP